MRVRLQPRAPGVALSLSPGDQEGKALFSDTPARDPSAGVTGDLFGCRPGRTAERLVLGVRAQFVSAESPGLSLLFPRHCFPRPASVCWDAVGAGGPEPEEWEGWAGLYCWVFSRAGLPAHTAKLGEAAGARGPSTCCQSVEGASFSGEKPGCVMEMGRSFPISVSPSPPPSLSPSAHSSRVQQLLPDNLTLCTGLSRTVGMPGTSDGQTV